MSSIIDIMLAAFAIDRQRNYFTISSAYDEISILLTY
jgi:hypothetical protein